MQDSSAFRLETGEVRIEDVKLDTRSRDDIPTLLMGLQELYGDGESRARLFAKLEKQALSSNCAKRRSTSLGLWQIYVLANLRQALKRDVEYILHLANHFYDIREFLGMPAIPDGIEIERGALLENIDLFGQEFIVESCKLIMKSGREARKRAAEAARLRAAAKRLARSQRLPKSPKTASKGSSAQPDEIDPKQGEFRFDP